MVCCIKWGSASVLRFCCAAPSLEALRSGNIPLPPRAHLAEAMLKVDLRGFGRCQWVRRGVPQ